MIIVIPCFDEERRLSPEALFALASEPGVGVLLVDDGSTDGTLGVLESVRAREPGRFAVLALGENQGKAEAVRRGLLAAIASGASVVGYLDADLATPAAEMLRVVRALEERGVEVATGARVKLAGRQIRRRESRHFVGRVFATFASLVLRAEFYDTQCGAKAFRVSDRLRACLSTPFRSTWSFDVELLGRLQAGTPEHRPLPTAAFFEVPLERWTDIPGSKLSVRAMIRAAADLAVIEVDLRERRRLAAAARR